MVNIIVDLLLLIYYNIIIVIIPIYRRTKIADTPLAYHLAGVAAWLFFAFHS